MAEQYRVLQSQLAIRHSVSDRLIFWWVNLCAYLRHPLNIARFRYKVGYFPNVARPALYSEKMLWRKIFDHNPLHIIFSDKLATKTWQEKRCPGLGILPVLWLGTDASAIPDKVLKGHVAIKANHGSGFNYFPSRDATAAQLPVDRINGWLKTNFGRGKLEWAYRFAGRKIFVEECVMDAHERPSVDISVHAGNGTPLFIEAITGNKTDNQQKAYFRTDGTRWVEIEKKPTPGNHGSSLPYDFQLPATYVEALDHTSRLSEGVDYARFDFLSTTDRLYGGEITIYPASGLTNHAQFSNYNEYVTEHWDLLSSWFLTTRHRGTRRTYAAALHRHLKTERKPR